ncbi:MAG: nucleoside-diphosphate-sugar pyrophosphorylase [bacterium]|nr:nucleoside-diphosphate-sugar pyrophosphorylase [bacterium]
MKNKSQYKVLITTSGTGSRLGDITKYTNKALVKVGKKPAISYIIEAYPEKTEFVITIGYFGNQVIDFLKLAYPDLHVKFVKVDKYEGAGTSLAYSMLQAEPFLRCPFIYHACDTIVSGKIPNPSKNWIGGFRGDGSSQYASFDTVEGKVQKMYDKGMIDPDYLHIGLVGVHNYMSFWNALRDIHSHDRDNGALNDVDAIRLMMGDGQEFEASEFTTWHDIGNVESLHKARKEIKDSFQILDKPDESIFIFQKFVIKFFFDEKMVSQRVARGGVLKGLVPEIEGSAGNFYRYKYAKGDLYSNLATTVTFSELLALAQKKLWKEESEVLQDEFKKVCYDFYYNKTIERVNRFLESRTIKDLQVMVNGEKVPTVSEMLKIIDFNDLSNAKQTGFHGDFILDNILKDRAGYVFLDWRQNFGGLLKAGDAYYDLAKLNHNLTVNHEIVNSNLFTITIDKNSVSCDIMRKENLVQCQKVLFEFIEKNNYSAKKVKILTALIWLNMSPLHHHPFDLFLFYFGKLNLWRALNDK